MTELQLNLDGAFTHTAAELQQMIRKYILDILESQSQPSAGELLAKLENRFDWRVRQMLFPVVKELCEDKTVSRYQRDYLKTNLHQEDIEQALRGAVKPSQDFKSTIDKLITKSRLYRSSSAFQEAVAFMAKFRAYAPFNNLLVKVQNPACGFYATEKDWNNKFRRWVKEDARPMLILAPMHPVMLVYDVDSTDGQPLPKHFEDFGITQADKDWNYNILEQTLMNSKRDLIDVHFKPLSKTMSGFTTTRVQNQGCKMRIVVNNKEDLPSRYSILCHELAHIYLGHLGGDRDRWWPSRINLSHPTVEIEAEAAAYTVAIRTGLRPASDSYLSSYLTDKGVPDSVSMELIAKVSGRIEEMGKRKLPPRKRLKQPTQPADNENLLF